MLKNDTSVVHHEIEARELLARLGEQDPSTAEFDGVVCKFPNADIARQAVHVLNALTVISAKLEKVARELEVLHKRSQFHVVEQ